MNWLKRLFTRPIQIVDPTFGAMTLENANWLALPDADRHHLVILEADEMGPSEQQRLRYTAIVQRIDLLIDQSIDYLCSRPKYTESIGTSKLELYAVIINNRLDGEELDFTLEFSLDEDAVYGVIFVADRPVARYLDH